MQLNKILEYQELDMKIYGAEKVSKLGRKAQRALYSA